MRTKASASILLMSTRSVRRYLALQYSVSPVLITSHLASAFDLVWRGVPPGQPERRKGIEEVMLWRRR